MDNLQEFLISKLGKENVLKDEPMSNHTTFKTGGKADYFVTPSLENLEDIMDIITYAKDNNINYTILGNGSNVLVKDEGIRGITISLKKINEYKIEDDCVIAGAGLSVAKLSKIYLDNSFKNMEFACGIPGTLGGAIYMNAGAYGGEIKDVIIDVTYLDLNTLEIHKIPNEECEFAYRSSIFHNKNALILSATLHNEHGDKEVIKAKMDSNMESRKAKQPVDKPCAGSIFRREEGIIVAKLIDEAGLKGYKIGGAEVSTLHAGFIINSGNATSKDVLDLIAYVKKVIFEKYNVVLHEEIKII